ncbi:MAG TPA: Ig domain-containing protein, partial [Candidatus Nanoarchaeia archaeon]|nr:Ig domain-containing protein [Candidatus Nanoarchaeia archaeon]
WTPGFDQAGSFSVTFTATDGSASSSETITITVTNTNRNPILGAIGNKIIEVGMSLIFLVTGSDPDGDAVTLLASGLPSGATFTSGTFSWTPNTNQEGDHRVTFTASDGSLTDSETITITVEESDSEAVLIKSVAFPDEDYAVAGKELMALVTIENDGNQDLDDIRIKAYILEEGHIAVSEPFDLDSNYPESKLLLFKLPKDIDEGWHTVGFSVYNGDIRRVVYRDLYIRGRG